MLRIQGMIAAAAAVGTLAAPAGAATLDRYTSFFAFGDSLTDTGNLSAATGGGTPPSPPYFDGRFSNGPVWVERVASRFVDAGLATANFAFGGAKAASDADGIPDLAQQIGLFQASVPAPALGSRALASLWFGANDLLAAIGVQPMAGVEAVARAAAQTVAAGAQALAALGIGDFVVFNLPDLGATPLYTLANPDAATDATAATLAFNEELDRQVDLLRAFGLGVTEIDIAMTFESLLDDPSAFGLTDAVLPCLVPGVSLCTPEEAASKAFWDLVHPTAVVHGEIAEIVNASVAPVPLPAPLAGLVAALAALAGLRHARRPRPDAA